MSKENVALFVRMIAEKRDLNKKASAERNTTRWVQLGKEVGLDYTENDVVGFVGEVIGRKVNADNAVMELLKEVSVEDLSADDLDKVVGGTSLGGGPPAINFSVNLSRQMISAGFTPPGGLGAQYVEFPPDPCPPGGFGGTVLGGGH